MKTVVSILGCGWIGLELARHLASRGVTVYGSTTHLTNLPRIKEVGAQPFLICLPLENDADTCEAFFSTPVLVVTIPFLRTYQDPWSYFYLLEPLFSILDKNLNKQIIFTSSTSIYSDLSGEVNEDSALDLSLERQKVLFAVEQEFLKRKGVVLRLGGLYGGDRKVTPRGDLDRPINYVHREDVVQVIDRVIFNNIQGHIYNVVSDDHRTKREIFNHHLTHDFPRLDTAKIVSNTKLKNDLGYAFIHPKVSEI